jgi:hypothetical protein
VEVCWLNEEVVHDDVFEGHQDDLSEKTKKYVKNAINNYCIILCDYLMALSRDLDACQEVKVGCVVY